MASIYQSVKKLTTQFRNQQEQSGMMEEDVESEKDFEFLTEFHAQTSVGILVYNTISMTYDYCSPTLEDLLGYSPSDFKTGGLKFAMSLVHPDHAKIYSKELVPLMFKYMAIYAFKGQLKNLRFSYNFKIMNKEGQYIWAMHNSNVLKVNKWQVPLQFVTCITDFSEMNFDESVTLSISLKDQHITPLLTKRFYPHQASFQLSPKETLILQKIGEGKSSKAIAEELNLSVHTVNTHRKNMLEKTKSKNFLQLATSISAIQKSE